MKLGNIKVCAAPGDERLGFGRENPSAPCATLIASKEQ